MNAMVAITENSPPKNVKRVKNKTFSCENSDKKLAIVQSNKESAKSANLLLAAPDGLRKNINKPSINMAKLQEIKTKISIVISGHYFIPASFAGISLKHELIVYHNSNYVRL
jgi:hypothetical protein